MTERAGFEITLFFIYRMNVKDKNQEGIPIKVYKIIKQEWICLLNPKLPEPGSTSPKLERSSF